MTDFTNIDGVYAKDTELRSGIDTLRTTVLSNTIKPLTVTKNDTYTAIPSSGTYGYSPIIVDVQEEPWTPLQDGYTNFWFELTNDTLSPWLNFSAKTESAVIDWGDGSGEVALDTLTPTHTYSKPGRYIVKVKGVTGIAQQHTAPYTEYIKVLRYLELNNEVTTIQGFGFEYCVCLNDCSIPNTVNIGVAGLRYCTSLEKINANYNYTNNNIFSYCLSANEIEISSAVTSITVAEFSYCVSIKRVTIPASVASIGINAFTYCSSLSEIHVLPTTPPTLGTNAFNGLPSDFIIYVPVGYGDTYKAASGWSTYADHILEEGQTPNRAMLAKFNSDNTDNEEMR